MTGNIRPTLRRRQARPYSRRATIRDVAARAGVSHQTVSRVINGNPNVAETTLARVLEAIDELGYVPSPMARGLISNRTHSLGVVATDVSDHFFAQVVAGAEAEAQRRGYYLIIGSVEPEDDGRGYLRLMLERRVEGLIVANPNVPIPVEHLEAAEEAGVPLLAVAYGELPGFVVVDVDNSDGGYQATRHLLRRGHRNVATIVGPREFPSSAARLDGYLNALREAGVVEDPALVEPAVDWSPESGRGAAARLLERAMPFTALFAHSDLLAIGAISALRAAGLRVPDDVSVVGYDDLPFAAFLDPPLTTVHQPMREVGALAASLVLDQLAGIDGSDATRHVLPAELVERASVVPAR